MLRNFKLEKLKKFLAPADIESQLVVQALTHPSFASEQKGSMVSIDNQRLEFLGDAVLQWLSAEFLYRNFPAASEGWMTQSRSVLVSREALYELAIQVDVPFALKLGKSEEKDGGRKRISTISDAMEALVGAVFLEIGENSIKEWAKRVLYDFWTRRLDFAATSNPKGVLQEHLQRQGIELPVYEVVSVTGPDHARRFDVRVISRGKEIGRGSGSSKKEAEVEAAKTALKELLIHNRSNLYKQKQKNF
jgi:ribonuclease-3